MNIGIIGQGAIGRYVHEQLLTRGHVLRALVLRPEQLLNNETEHNSTIRVASIADLPDDIDHMIDCAGHSALKSYGPDILRRGFDLTTVSIGALADAELYRILEQAAIDGHAKLHLASGAAVALAGLGFDDTKVKLIADPNVSDNIHEVHATGNFGRFSFEISGRSLPDNPCSSALAAMSVVSNLEQRAQSVCF